MRFGHGYGRWIGGGFGHGMHGEDHRGWGGRERGGGRRRVFDGGDFWLVLLSLLENRPRHG